MTISRGECHRLVRVALLLWCSVSASAQALECPPLAVAAHRALGAYADAHGLLWRVTAVDGRESVLLGTMHVGDERVTRIIEATLPDFARSRRFALEVLFDEQAAGTFQRAMFHTDGTRLVAQVGPALFEAAVARLADYGMMAEQVAVMKPWAAFVTLSVPVPAGDAPLDLVLLARARAAGMSISALETVDEQLAVFDRLPLTEQVAMLREAVCHYDRLQAEIDVMIAHYAARDLGALTRASLEHIDAAREPLLDALLWSRSRRMVERMQPLLAAGDSFIAVGAMHLPGDRGILHLLEQRGFRVEAIY